MSSLQIAGIELLNLGPYQLLRDFDYGSPDVETQSVPRMLFDGDVVTGRRSGNRQVTLPIRVVGSTSTARAALINSLATLVDKPFQLVWTPNGGLPVVFDCYRATVTPDYDSMQALQGFQLLSVTFQAEPFTRTPNAVAVAPVATAYTLIDGYDALTGLTVNNATASIVTTPKVEGTGALALAFTVPAASGAGTPASPIVPGSRTITATKTFGAVNMSTIAVVGMYAQTPGASDPGFTSKIFTLKLSSAGGSKTWTVQQSPYGDGYKFINFDLSAPISTSTGTLDLTAVTGYEWTFYTSNFGSTAYSYTMNVDRMAGYQGGSASNLTGASGYIRFDGIQGSARTPVSVTIDAASAVRRVLLARSPNPPAGFNPVLSTPNSHGGASANVDAISGTGYDNPVYRIAATSVSGTYAIVVRAKITGTVTVTATAKITGDTYTQSVATPIVPTETAAFALYAIGELTLPPREVDGTNTAATVDLAISGSPSSIAQIDQTYLVDMAGDSLLIDMPSGTAYRYFFIDAPNSGRFGSRILAGSTANRSDALAVTQWVRGPAAFNFDPGSNQLLVVLDKATGTPAITANYYPRFLYERAA